MSCTSWKDLGSSNPTSEQSVNLLRFRLYWSADIAMALPAARQTVATFVQFPGDMMEARAGSPLGSGISIRAWQERHIDGPLSPSLGTFHLPFLPFQRHSLPVSRVLEDRI